MVGPGFRRVHAGSDRAPARIDPDDLREQLERVEAPESGTGPDELYELQQNYFRDLFLPQLYDALPAHGRLGLSRLAVTEIPLLLVGVALVANIGESEVQDSVNRWLRLGLVQRFGEDDEVPVFAIYPLQRTFLIEPARLGGAAAQDAHRATATFLRECFEKGRQSELRLPLVAGLLACLHHATEARDPECRRWATVELAWRLIGCAEYVVAEALVKPVMQDDRHPDLLNILARVRLGTSDWKSARELYQEVLIGREACRDRSGEGSVWHNLATIDSNERVYDKAREKFAKSLSIRQALGDRVGEASTRNSLAAIDVEEGKYEKAREKLGEVLAMYQALGNRAGEGSVRHNLATIDLYEGKYEGARENYGRALEAKHAVGDRAGEASVWHGLASVDVSEGNYKDAREELGKALEIFRAIRDRAAEASTWHQLGLIDLHEGKSEQARQNYGKALGIGQAIGDPAREASAWHGLGSVALNEKKYDEAREKYKKSLSISQSIGDRACEAASFYQIGVMAWELAQREVGIRLIALGLAIQTAIGAGEVQVKLTGLVSMAQDMGLDPAGFEELTKEVVKGYRGDRGAALLKTAFEGL
ncbi:MAG: tetratricopeptide repeat protein [Candidatus Hydrogenedentes bacterium]|nr:tetratricopeptide repeat protein [Candidatus Hydrogenedentota bacterium]